MNEKKLIKNFTILFQLLIVVSIIPFQGIEAGLNILQDFQLNDVSTSTKTVMIPTEVLTPSSINQSYKPEVFVDSFNNIHVAWQEEFSTLPDKIYYTFWNSTTGVWNETEIVNKESNGDAYNPTLAVDNIGNVYIAWDDRGDYGGSGTDGDIFFRIWNTTTNSWTNIEVVSVGDATSCYRASLGIDLENNIYLTWMNYESVPAPTYTIFNIYYNFRDAKTGVWNGTEMLSDTTPDVSQNPSLVVDKNNNIHITWRTSSDYGSSDPDADIVYRFWNATANTWSATEVISTESTNASYYPHISTDIGGNIHIVWHDETDYDSAGTDYDIFYKYWNVTTDTWSTTEVISKESTENSRYPRMAVDVENNLRVVWQDQTDYDSAGTDNDIFYRCWDATNASWSVPLVISMRNSLGKSLKNNIQSSMLLAEANYSTTPSLALDTVGNFYIAWADYSDYLGSGAQDSDIFFRRTIDFPAPILESISPNPSTTGDITLTWNVVDYATEYRVYRSESEILSIEGLIPIAAIGATTYNDLLITDGTYYYVIVASTAYAESHISNVESVVVSISSVSEYQIGTLFVFAGITFGLIAFIAKRRRK